MIEETFVVVVEELTESSEDENVRAAQEAAAFVQATITVEDA